MVCAHAEPAGRAPEALGSASWPPVALSIHLAPTEHARGVLHRGAGVPRAAPPSPRLPLLGTAARTFQGTRPSLHAPPGSAPWHPEDWDSFSCLHICDSWLPCASPMAFPALAQWTPSSRQNWTPGRLLTCLGFYCTNGMHMGLLFLH